VANTTILSAAVNQNLTDIASGLSDCLTRDNQAGMSAVFRAVSGSAAAPGITFTSDTTTGLYLPASHQLGFASNGTQAGYFDTDQTLVLSSTGSMLLPRGTSAQQPGSPAAGMFRYNTDNGNPEFYNTAWNPLLVSLAGKQQTYGDIINGTIVASNSANAATFALKTLAGTDPSANDPVLVCFRNATIATGNYVALTVTAALSLTVTSGATLGAVNGTPFKLWLVLFNDASTLRLGVINTVSGTNIYPLCQVPLASSTAMSAGADSAQVFYTGTGVTSKAYLPLGYASYESGLATAGTWNVDPTRIQLFGHGVAYPGATIQTVSTLTGASTTGSTQIPQDDTIPQSGEGDQYMTQAITPTSAANILEIESRTNIASSIGANLAAALFQDSGNNALTATISSAAAANTASSPTIFYPMLAATTSATTFKIRAGTNGGTNTFNGISATRVYGGVLNSYIRIRELMT
jgi:hypothetical protein